MDTLLNLECHLFNFDEDVPFLFGFAGRSSSRQPEYKVEGPAPAEVDLPAPAAVIEHVTPATTRLFQGARVGGQGVEGQAGVGGPTRTGLTARACRSLQPADEFLEITLDLNVPAADRPYLCVRR
jgi:hypothetical protein